VNDRGRAARQQTAGAGGRIGRTLRTRHRRLVGPHRLGLERDGLLATADPGLESIDFLRTALDGERTETGLQAREQAPAERCPIVLAALRARLLKLAGRKGRRRISNYLPLAGLPQVVEQLDGGAGGLRAALPLSSACPASASRSSPLARFMFASYVTVPSTRTSSAGFGYGNQIAEMCEALGGARPRARHGRRPWDLIADTFVFGTARSRCRSGSPPTSKAEVTLPVLLPITTPDKFGETIEALGPK